MKNKNSKKKLNLVELKAKCLVCDTMKLIWGGKRIVCATGPSMDWD